MNMLQQALQCPDGTILLPRYEGHFLNHEQEDGRGYFIDGGEMCRYGYSDDDYELLLIDEGDLMPHVVDSLVLVTKYGTERFNGLSDEQLKQRHASKVFPEWIENCFKWRMGFAYRADKKYEGVKYTMTGKQFFEELLGICCPATAQKWEKKDDNKYIEKIKKVLTLYRQLDNISTSLDMFVTSVADDGFAIGINISLSPVVDELIGEYARKDVEYYLYEDIDDKYIELKDGTIYKLNTDEEFMDYMYNIYGKDELTK